MGGKRKNYNKNRSKRPRQLGKKKFDENGQLIDDRNTEAGAKLGYKDIVRENKKFEEFYKAQQICPDEEFNDMIKALQLDLPASFRITGFRSHAKSLLNVIKGEYFKEFTDFQAKGGKVVVPTCLQWYPDQLAYQLNVTRKDIRREEIYFKLHNFLVAETESGNTTRQETVSMIPPLVLDVKPHHKVLDMCAAPGSKTGQLIEALHQDESTLPTGLLVANDADNSRCYMLTHQAKRLQSPAFLITNHDASIMPNIYVPDPDSTEPGKNKVMKFDRILCDVPCTGDGTMRKNPDIWTKWNPSNGANLHGIQFRILKRGIELLEVGGRIVYSTCSLNPTEDEAVIARMLKETAGTMELVHVADSLPGLKHAKGVSSWVLADRKGNIFKSWEEVPEDSQNLVRPYMFPPPPGQETDNLHLDRCIRILPHQQNTGGFFVALLEKKALCPWEKQPKKDRANGKEKCATPEANGEASTTDDANGTIKEGEEKIEEEPPKKKPKNTSGFRGFREDPYIYLKSDDPIGPEITNYYGLKLPVELFLSRCKDESKKNNLYFTTKAVKEIVENNTEKVKVINTGVKAWTKCENKGSECGYRIAQEGVLMMLNHITERKLYPTKQDMETMLLNSDFDSPPEIAVMSDELKKQMENMSTGSIALIYCDKDKFGSELKVEIVGWKGQRSVRAYVPKNERVHYLRLIGGDVTKFEKNKFEDKKVKENAEQQQQQQEDDPSPDTLADKVDESNGDAKMDAQDAD